MRAPKFKQVEISYIFYFNSSTHRVNACSLRINTTNRSNSLFTFTLLLCSPWPLKTSLPLLKKSGVEFLPSWVHLYCMAICDSLWSCMLVISLSVNIELTARKEWWVYEWLELCMITIPFIFFAVIFQTFSQLCAFDYETKAVQIYRAPWYILDKPRFAYRGLLLGETHFFCWGR